MAFKAFIKPFEAPQRNVKIKISVNFSFFVHDRGGKAKSDKVLSCNKTSEVLMKTMKEKYLI